MSHLHPTQASGAAFVARGIEGPVVMLNLLRFRDVADYSATPELAPRAEITGFQAYRRYMAHTQPFLEQVGGQVLLSAEGGSPLIGPADERWDLILLVRYPDSQAFLSFAGNEEYLAGVGHRTAALEDSRLLPLAPTT